MRRGILLVMALITLVQPVWAGRAKIDTISRDPYLSALVIDAATGKILAEDNSTARAYPASVLKMMVLLVVLEQVEQGVLSLDEMVQVTQEAARMGGSQVYLDSKEQFPVEDLLYALMIQSANDAAVALAVHVSGSKEQFIALMNKRAAELGMKDTQFHSVHGLPPAEGQQVDVTTARDLARLGMELAKKQETFKYTGTREREFRNGEFIMRTHNHLLTRVDGCDGFKTGYFKAAGFSIVATAKRSSGRVIAVVLGSADRKVRDAKAAEFIARGFRELPSVPVKKPVQAVEKVQPQEDTVVTVVPSQKQQAAPVNAAQEESEKPAVPSEVKVAKPFTERGWLMFWIGFGVGLLPAVFLIISRSRRSRRSHRLM